MSSQDGLDPWQLTFSQAYGYKELPQPLKLEELSDSARVKLWSLLYRYVSIGSRVLVGRKWSTILMTLHVGFLGQPWDEFTNRTQIFVNNLKRIFLESPFHEVFDSLLAIMRHRECPRDFSLSVAVVFEQCRLACIIDVGPPPTIYPAATGEEGGAIVRATAELSSAGLAGAASHLRHASDCISRGDYPGAVRESIHAVESTARHFDPTAKTLNPALKMAFSNLYGFTSDEQGIRHALIDNPQANVDLDEAVFMLGACASFSCYLARKHQRQVS